MRIKFLQLHKFPVFSTAQLFISLFFLSFWLSAAAQSQGSFTPYSAEVDVPIEMVPVEGGIFTLGSAGDTSMQTEVEIEPFWMGKYEISWEQYKQFSTEVIRNLQEQDLPGEEALGIGADAISLPSPPYVDMSFGMGTDGYPAISMTHYAASMFTKWLTAKTGHFYRLPTEAEWEYACRAGLETVAEDIDRQAWFKENSNRGYQKTGTKQPNGFGLYDMLGNVAEWTADQYHENYYERINEMSDGGLVNTPWFEAEELYPRAVRGASWMDTQDRVSCTERRGSSPDWKRLDPQLPKSLWWHTSALFLGFRIVRPANEPLPEQMENYWPEAVDDF